MKKFVVIIPREDGGAELHPMKEWLRQHPEHIPSGCDANTVGGSTSRQLRGALVKLGWTSNETTDQVQMIPPSQTLNPAIKEIFESATDDDELEGSDPAFGLEAHLRDFIAQNIEVIDVGGKRLQLFVSQEGRDGIEYPTAVGQIDILAIDESGNFYIFELKRARSPDAAIGQLTRYMGWVKQTIGKDKTVNGVIVAKEISQNLRYAVSVVPNVSLFEYEVSFQLKPAHQLN